MTSALVLTSVAVDVGTRRKHRRILHNIDLVVDAGESVAIMGASGSGKSTLLAACLGLIPVAHGTVTLRGTDLASCSPARLSALRARHIGMVFQSGELLRELTPLENVALPAVLNGVDAATARSRAAARLAAVGLSDLGSPTDRLSGGERQRVALARALVNDPSLVLADEPTGGLDSTTRDLVVAGLFAVPAATSCGLLVATHDEHVAGRADRVFQLSDGKLRPLNVSRR